MTLTVSIITTCKGRLHHLRQTLPSMLSQEAEEVVVVDYDCPDGTGDWVTANHPSVAVVNARNTDGSFSAARARNLGAAAAAGEWIAFLDADCNVEPGWLNLLRERCAEGDCFFVVPDDADPDLMGAVFCRKREFLLSGWYDEAIRGCGAEDTDLRLRLRAIGLEQRYFAASLLRPIKHGNHERVTERTMSVDLFRLRNQLYLNIKRQMTARLIGMEECCRTALLETLTQTVEVKRFPRTSQYYPIRFHRYCPACAERFSTNTELMLVRRPRTWWRDKTFFLAHPDGTPL